MRSLPLNYRGGHFCNIARSSFSFSSRRFVVLLFRQTHTMESNSLQGLSPVAGGLALRESSSAGRRRSNQLRADLSLSLSLSLSLPLIECGRISQGGGGGGIETFHFPFCVVMSSLFLRAHTRLCGGGRPIHVVKLHRAWIDASAVKTRGLIEHEHRSAVAGKQGCQQDNLLIIRDLMHL